MSSDQDVAEASTIWESLAPPWQCCLEEAWAAYCAGSLPIGAVVTDVSGRLLSRGRNRIFDTTAHKANLYGHRLAHAEMNALIALDHGNVDPEQCVLYTTTEPCPLCVGAIRMIGVRDVRYASRDSAAGSIELLTATPFMRRKEMRVVGPERADIEAVIVALNVEFKLHTDTAPAWVLDTWEVTVPAGVSLGRVLHKSGELRRMRDTATPIADVVDALAARLLG